MTQITTEEQINKLELLRQVPLFSGLNEEGLRSLAAVSRVFTLPQGDEIIEEGAELFEEDDGLYLLVDGTVEVRKGAVDGVGGQVVAQFGRGEFFGEMALLDGQPRSASVFATSEVLCLVLNRADLQRQLRSDPEIALKMLAVLSRRLRRMTESI
ncbi:MAG TPA: cyclic nucleotide-binding domain-containing protein [Thermomicrobiales bacterium]|jgi:CRP-like cAMP-binding protein